LQAEAVITLTAEEANSDRHVRPIPKKKNTERKWKHSSTNSLKVDLNKHIGEAPPPVFDSPMAAFSEFFNTEMLDLIIKE